MKSSKRTKPLPPFFLPPNLLEVRENGTEEEFVELLQPHIRYMARASKAGAIAGCRAAAAAVVAPAVTSPRPFTAPSRPCISSNQLHHAWLVESRVYLREIEAAYPDVGDGEGA
jgi:hypothetical protein